MKCSELAIFLLAARECGYVKTNSHFWKTYADKNTFINTVTTNTKVQQQSDRLIKHLSTCDYVDGIICCFDQHFPVISPKVMKDSEKPYLLFYSGDISLLNDLNQNIAVVGLIDPDPNIELREKEIVRLLVERNLVIVSGLAEGCDTIAHTSCIEFGGKTIAILPSTLRNIAPAKNTNLARMIKSKGGLLVSEYYREPMSKYDAIARYIERDRLQAMFAKAVVLIASYRQGEGDSGSRHAMLTATKYGISRYVMYDALTDGDDKRFGLNRELLGNNSAVLLSKPLSFDELQRLSYPFLSKTGCRSGEQLSIFSL